VFDVHGTVYSTEAAYGRAPHDHVPVRGVGDGRTGAAALARTVPA